MKKLFINSYYILLPLFLIACSINAVYRLGYSINYSSKIANLEREKQELIQKISDLEYQKSTLVAIKQLENNSLVSYQAISNPIYLEGNQNLLSSLY